jgi:hypothetical protein
MLPSERNLPDIRPSTAPSELKWQHMPPRTRRLSRRTHRWLNVGLLLPVALLVSIIFDELSRQSRDYMASEIRSTGGLVTSPPSLFENLRNFAKTRNWQSDTDVWLPVSTMDGDWIREHDYLRGLKITRFIAGKTEFDADVVARLIEEHPLRCLVLSHQKNADLVATALSRERGLSDLELNGSDLTDVGFQHLPLEQLETLGVASTRVSSTRLLDLSRSQRLTYLAIEGRQVDVAVVEMLSRLTELRTLTLTGPEIADEQIEMLRPLTNLSYVNVEDTAITQPGVKKLEATLPGCRVEVYPRHEPEE